MKREVVVTGMGCVTPLGNDPDTLWSNIAAGKSGVGLITLFDASDLKTKIAAEVKDFNPLDQIGRDARRMDRFSQFAVVAARQAITNANLHIDEHNRDSIGVVVGSGIGGILTLVEQSEVLFKRGAGRITPLLVPMMLVDSAGANIAIDLGMRGPNLAVVTACATGTNTIGEAAEIIRRGQAEVMLAGGSEAGISALSMAGLINATALSTNPGQPETVSRPFDRKRDGFVIGEGAAILVLESLEHAQNRKAKILATITGYGSTNDAYHISAPAESGEGAVRCMKMAFKDAGLSPADIHYINAHGTSTVLNDKTETAAIKAVFGEIAYSVPVSSTKSMLGHLLGASGSVEAVLCVQALQSGVLPPTINYHEADPDCDLDYIPNSARKVQNINHVMSNSFGFGGHNASIIISKFDQPSHSQEEII
jgi:3-oxoacyl-[acyl-carrier-protein] synthase II